MVSLSWGHYALEQLLAEPSALTVQSVADLFGAPHRKTPAVRTFLLIRLPRQANTQDADVPT